MTDLVFAFTVTQLDILKPQIGCVLSLMKTALHTALACAPATHLSTGVDNVFSVAPIITFINTHVWDKEDPRHNPLPHSPLVSPSY